MLIFFLIIDFLGGMASKINGLSCDAEVKSNDNNDNNDKNKKLTKICLKTFFHVHLLIRGLYAKS